MKHSIFVLFFIFYFLHFTRAQSFDDSVVKRQSYLFDHFINGSVLSKSGEVNQAPLNYSSYDQSILFEKDGKIFTLTGLLTVDTVYIKEKKFVPLNNKIYEVINTIGKVQLLLSYSGKMRPWTATTDHNGTTNQSTNQVNNTVSDVYLSRNYKGNYSVEIIKHYWLNDYKNLYRANNARDFLKVFRESTNPAINEYIKENHINFKNEPDLVKLVNFCNRQ